MESAISFGSCGFGKSLTVPLFNSHTNRIIPTNGKQPKQPPKENIFCLLPSWQYFVIAFDPTSNF